MLKEKLKRAQEALGKVWEEYKEFRNGIHKDPVKWTAEERRRLDAFDKDIDRYDAEIDGINRQIADEDRVRRFTGDGDADFGPPLTEKRSTFGQNSWVYAGEQRDRNRDDFFEYRSNREGSSMRHTFNRYLEFGVNAINPEEYRTLTAGNDLSGGNLMAPPAFVKALMADLSDECVIRKLAKIHNIRQYPSMGVPMLESDLDDATWTTELATGNQDDGLKFGKRELRPHPLAKRVLISNTLLRTSQLSPEAIVRERMAAKFGTTEEKAFLTGDGQNKPLGLFTPSSDGISTARDVVGSNSATLIKPDTLIDALYSLSGAYQKNATWLFHRDAIRNIRKLKDANEQYIWRQGLGGSPNTILEHPYVVSEFAPNDFTAEKYVGIVGDFKYYWIAVGLEMQVQRLGELYAEKNLVGFIGRLEVDAMPVLENAFTRIKMAA